MEGMKLQGRQVHQSHGACVWGEMVNKQRNTLRWSECYEGSEDSSAETE